MSGTFYPTGYMFLMFPSGPDALRAARELIEAGFEERGLSLLTPKEIEEAIASSVAEGAGLPSASTEGDTARRYGELARQGHHALMARAPDGRMVERAMRALEGHPVSYGQKYRQLVIEDLA